MEHQSKVHRLTRDDLYKRVWSTPMKRLAEEFGVSDVGLSKFCHRHHIPTPPRGYWMMPEEKKVALKPRLPDSTSTDTLEIHASVVMRTVANTPIHVSIPEDLHAARPVVVATARALRAGKRGEDGLLSPAAKGALPVRVGPASVERAARILDALLTCLEERGHRFTVRTDQRGASMVASVAGEDVPLLLGEEVDREERELTTQEKRLQERSPWLYRQPLYTYSPSGRIFLKLDHYCSGLRKNWVDGKRQRLEQCLGAVIAQLETVAAQMKTDREERDAEARRRVAWEQERTKKLEGIRAEEERLKTLHAQADAWHRSQRIRRFADAVRIAADEGRLRSDFEVDRWLEWASQQADRLDPLTKSPASVIDEKAKYEPNYWRPPSNGESNE